MIVAQDSVWRPTYEPLFADYESVVRESFARRAVMATLKTKITDVGPGWIELALPWQDEHTQQNGFLHAGVTATVLDTACGYSALSLMPSGSDITTIEFSISLLTPATPDSYQARAWIIRRGRNVLFARAEAMSVQAGSLVASMSATLYRVPNHPVEQSPS